MITAVPTLSKNPLQRKAGTMLVVAFLGIFAVLLIPLPTFLMDLLITVNVSISLLILLSTLSANRPLDFSTFPTVILFTALFRLSLNVASTRLILLEGDAGSIIRSFGDFVVGGNYVVGTVVFLILIVIQFAVITKGQNRIAEVAARFTLDAMPGKQMAIDADLNAGIISNEEAKERREDIARESEFYGAMDGAGKFVRGDAVAGLIITAINILGGILIGSIQRGMSVGQAMQTYTVLTVGDGLVSQIPGLIVSIAAGILVTKAASKVDLQEEISEQIAGEERTLFLAGLVLWAIAIVPGFPFVPFSILGTGLILYSRRKKTPGQEGPEVEEEEDEGPQSEEEELEELLRVDRLGIEIGYRLIPIVDPGKHGGLLEHIASMRKQFAASTGMVVPPIRVKDNIQLEPNEYRILLMGQEIGKGELRAGQYLAIDPTGNAPAIEGTDTVEPAFGLPAKWITEGQKEQAEIMGYTVIEAPNVLVTHLTELLKNVSHEVLSREDVQALLDNLKKTAPTIVQDTVPGVLSVSQVQRLLSNLLKEQVPIRNLALILEAASDTFADTKDLGQVTEQVRLRLSRAITEPLVDKDGTLHVATIDPKLEGSIAQALTGAGQPGGGGVLEQGALGRFVETTAEILAELVKQGHPPVLVTRAALRPLLAEAILGAVPGSAVLSYQEISHLKKIDVISQIGLEGAAA
ncbi:MAG TPA: flagellar biosynthesis protein FlhA [Planctomycetes bacterium]|nr:flagellar biosynthesis protein FlhA [Planctomycetota bacterium]